MNHEQRTQTSAPALHPEALEEQRLRARIEVLREELAALATELEQLRTELGAFEARYDARIGVLMVEQDRFSLEIAIQRRKTAALRESLEAWQQVDAEIEQEMKAERERLAREEREASEAGRRVKQLPPPPEPEVAARIRGQYRKLARRFHPDVAADAEQREQNEHIMRRINQAMERYDLDSLVDLEVELPRRDVDLPGPTPGARIAWALDEIARLEAVLMRRTGELAALRSSSLHRLWQRVEADPAILDRLESDLRGEIATAEMELRALTTEYDGMLRRVALSGAGGW